MRLAYLSRPDDPFSLQIYQRRVLEALDAEHVQVITVRPGQRLPREADLFWDPGLSGNRPLHAPLRRCPYPLMVTVHGAAPLTLSWYENYRHPLAALRGWLRNRRLMAGWRWLRERVEGIIAVSEFCANEVATVFKIESRKIIRIYHGVDHRVFHPKGATQNRLRPFLLMVAQYQTKKNVRRVLQAYAQLPQESRPDLVLILPGYRGPKPAEPGIHLIGQTTDPETLASWYRGALGLVFPSLHETFGLPIVEAMACGCPVITSDQTACPEVANGAAQLVDPRSVTELAAAMQRLVRDADLRNSLRVAGLARAMDFDWACCAHDHLAAFRQAAGGGL